MTLPITKVPLSQMTPDAMPTSVAESLAQRANEIAPVVEWDYFRNNLFDWKQGQHVAFIGPTESGKSTLALNVLGIRDYVTVLGTKPRDETLDIFAEQHKYKKLPRWKKLSPDRYPRRILWPDALNLYSAMTQRREFKTALEQIYREGGWCVYVDELWFIIHHLKLEFEIRTYLQQARSNGISLAVATQRPAFVPLEVYDQSSWLFFWRDNDETNLKRISGIATLQAKEVRYLVARLEHHQVLVIHNRTGKMYRTMAPAPTEG